MPIPSIIVQPGMYHLTNIKLILIVTCSISHVNKYLLFCSMSNFFNGKHKMSLCHTPAQQRIIIISSPKENRFRKLYRAIKPEICSRART